MIIWKMQVNIVLQRQALLDTNLESVYALIKGQCMKPILEKVEAQQEYAAAHQDRDPIRLLSLIKAVMFNYNSRMYRAMSVIGVIKPDIVSQTRYMSDSDYLEKFRNQLDVLKSAGGDICNHPGMIDDELIRAGITTRGTATQRTAATEANSVVTINKRDDTHRELF